MKHKLYKVPTYIRDYSRKRQSDYIQDGFMTLNPCILHFCKRRWTWRICENLSVNKKWLGFHYQENRFWQDIWSWKLESEEWKNDNNNDWGYGRGIESKQNCYGFHNEALNRFADNLCGVNNIDFAKAMMNMDSEDSEESEE